MTQIADGNPNTESLLKRVFMFLEDGEWASANEYCEKVLDINPECAEAYLGKLMAELHVKQRENLKNQTKTFDKSSNYQKALRFADDQLKSELESYVGVVNISAQKHSKLAKKKKRIIVTTSISVLCVVIAFTVLLITVIIPNIKWDKAVSLMNEGKYSEALDIFTELSGSYLKTSDLEHLCFVESKYSDAIALLNSGNIVQAYESLIWLDQFQPGFKDCAERAKSIEKEYRLKTARVGGYLTFGSYEQDNDTSNGPEDIEWLILDIQDGKALVISKYILYYKTYDGENFHDTTWKDCEIRIWLNISFRGSAFSTDEIEKIPMVYVAADENPRTATYAGDATTDYIFLLSIKEAEKYFSSDAARRCSLTEYAKSKAGYGEEWLLRTPGYANYMSAQIYRDGSIRYNGDTISSPCGIRPAMWIDLG